MTFRKSARRMFACAVLFLAIAAAGLALFTAWQARVIEARFPPTGKFVSVEGGRLYYTERSPMGAPRGAVLLLHGASGNQANMMAALGGELTARGFRVLAFDRPGHGWSERILGRAAASPAAQARLLAEALPQISAPRAIVVAHSLAGVVALNMALDQTQATQGVVLVSPVSHPWPGGVNWTYRVGAHPVWGPLFSHLIVMPAGLARLPQSIAGIFAPASAPPGFIADTAAPLVLRPREYQDNAQDVTALYDFVVEQAPRYPQIRVPVSILTGDEDSVVLTHIHSYGSARDIPGAKLQVIKGEGHAPHFAHAPAVAAAVEEVAGRVEARAAP
jgi:pimeloyl-ACP methyl ester carboxylesterase